MQDQHIFGRVAVLISINAATEAIALALGGNFLRSVLFFDRRRTLTASLVNVLLVDLGYNICSNPKWFRVNFQVCVPLFWLIDEMQHDLILESNVLSLIF